MDSKYQSTLNKPLLFLQVFLKQSNFNKFEETFYSNPINPSFVANRKEGFVEYLDDVYLNEEVITRRFFFKDKILKILVSAKNISIGLINDKFEEIDNSGNSTLNFIDNTTYKLDTLVEEVHSHNKLYHEIIPILKDIENTLIRLRKRKVSDRKLLKRTVSKQGLFRPDIKLGKLKVIYDLATELNILDENIVSQDDFVNVFTHPNPKQIDNKIIFSSDNRKAFYFIKNIQKFFTNLTPSAISESESFFSKGGTLIQQKNIDQVNHHLRNVDISKYTEILEAIKTMEKEHKF